MKITGPTGPQHPKRFSAPEKELAHPDCPRWEMSTNWNYVYYIEDCTLQVGEFDIVKITGPTGPQHPKRFSAPEKELAHPNRPRWEMSTNWNYVYYIVDCTLQVSNFNIKIAHRNRT